ncbi:M6 metalloprotease [Sarocladium strictum]
MATSCNGPCFVAPHPNLLARRKVEFAKVKGTAKEADFNKQQFVLTKGQRTGIIPGLNDGIIFPKSHFGKGVPLAAMRRAALERAPLRGAINVVLVLVEFTDVKLAPNAKQRFEKLFFSKGQIPTGSVSEYYEEVSNGKVSLTGDAIGPFTLSREKAYYANGAFGNAFPEPSSQTMANEAVSLATGAINFNKYDNDKNGYIDVFCVVHAGTGGEQSGNVNDIWSVKWSIPQERQLNDVKVFGFLTIPDDAKIGVSAHEIGHLLFGWPDLYDLDNSSSGVGDWCVMSYGSWGGGGDRPCHPSAWCKASQGWVDVNNETKNARITIDEVKSAKKIHRLWKDGDLSSQEYFLVENRGLSGFDQSLPGGGLLVWHIDDSVYDNNNEFHPHVGLVQADGLNQLSFRGGSDAGDPFPGIAGNRTFNAISNPNSKSYAGSDTFVSVTDIPVESMSMHINITVKAFDLPPHDQLFDSRKWYRITNTFQGHSLDVINDGAGNAEGLIQMARTGNFSGQFWQIVPSGGAGTFALRTLFLGASRQLDVYGDDKLKPHLAIAGNFSGQIWKIAPWGDGTWHLENTYSGSDFYLDTMEGGPRVAMNQANVGRPTQRWTITPIRGITESGF